MKTNIDIDKIFTYHSPNQEQKAFYENFRKAAKALAIMIDSFVPDCTEKNLAIEKLQECVMWGNAGVARFGIDHENIS